MVEMGQITPPIGVNAFIVSGIARETPMYEIFKGILPFRAAMIFVVVILVIFPQISLFLPNLMTGS